MSALQKVSAKAIGFGMWASPVVAALALIYMALYPEYLERQRLGALQGIYQAGESYSWQVACGTSATAIDSGEHSQLAYECSNPSATAVYLGDTNVNTTIGTAICNDTATCAKAYGGGPFRTEYCIVASGTTNITCRSKVTQRISGD